MLTSRCDFRRALVEPCHSFSDCLIVSRVNFPFVSSMQSWETILSSYPFSFGFNIAIFPFRCIPTNHLAKQSPDQSATNLLEFFTCGTSCLHSGQRNTNPAFSTGSMLISDTCQTQEKKRIENMCVHDYIYKIINIYHILLKILSIVFYRPEKSWTTVSSLYKLPKCTAPVLLLWCCSCI